MSYIPASVEELLRLAEDVFLLILDLGEGLAGAEPGQFVMVRPEGSHDPLLPRPFSIHEAKGSYLEILFRVVGRGTGLLMGLKKGDRVNIMGPLGRGFPLGEEKPLILAGGIGVAPFRFLARRLGEAGRAPAMIFGAKTQSELVGLENIRNLAEEIVLATEDGSCGRRGLATDFLEEMLAGYQITAVHACGPRPMLKKAFEIVEKTGSKLFVSLEEVMGCGVGVCLGCAVEKTGGGYLHLCTDGPVVDAREVRW